MTRHRMRRALLPLPRTRERHVGRSGLAQMLRMPRRRFAANDNTPPIPLMALRLAVVAALLAGAIYAIAG
jgi:hypothetical protein